VTTSPDDDGTPDDPQSIDAAFDEIVANIDQPGSDQHGTAASTAPWPSVEDRGSEPPAEPPAEPTPQRTPRSDWPEWDDVRMPSEPVEELAELAEPDEGHYVPPPPPPVPKGDPVARWAWAGAIGAPTLAILLSLLGRGLDGFTGIFLVGAFLAGFVTLISRMRTGPRVDDGPDDGAVV
jgi:hypothetical protein